MKKPPGEGTGPTTHADSQWNIVGRVPSRGEQDVFQRPTSGAANLIGGGSRYATICGGQGNRLEAVSGTSWGTIGGGLQNSIYGKFGAIGGGAGNLISGDCDTGPCIVYSTIAGGLSNLIYSSSATIAGGSGNFIPRGDYGTIAGGSGNLIGFSGFSAPYATIAGGAANNIFGASAPVYFSTIGGGQSNVVASDYATVPGGTQAKASQYGQMAYASGQFATNGDAQTSVLVCRGTTTESTQTELFLDGVSQRMIMPTNSTWAFDILLTARADNGDSAAYQLLGAAENNGGISAFLATPQKNVIAGNVAAWDVNLSAPGTNGTILITVAGQAATSIRWVASVRTVEVTY